MSNKEDIQIPEEYKQKSRHIEQLWELFLETGENLDRIVLEMRTILIDAGMGSTEAMNKIVQDHKHLKGFSRATLYRMLPAEEKRHKEPHGSKQQFSNENYEIPQTPPNIVDVEPEAEPIIQQPQPQEERRTPEAPDNSMVEQLHILNVQLKKDVDRLMDENIRLKQENQELKAELARHRRLEELRLEAQRKAIKEWRNPGHKP